MLFNSRLQTTEMLVELLYVAALGVDTKNAFAARNRAGTSDSGNALGKVKRSDALGVT